jgi:hypothetical protein
MTLRLSSRFLIVCPLVNQNCCEDNFFGSFVNYCDSSFFDFRDQASPGEAELLLWLAVFQDYSEREHPEDSGLAAIQQFSSPYW